MEEIKIKPVFEWIDGKWKLMTLDCPLGCGGEMEHYGPGDNPTGLDVHFTKIYECDTCKCTIEWYPYRFDLIKKFSESC